MVGQYLGQFCAAWGQQHQTEGTCAAVEAKHQSLPATETETDFINHSLSDRTIVTS